MEKEFICIVCPKGCRIKVDNEGNISGYTCLRGLNYVKEELTCPKRMLTSTVKVSNRKDTYVSVKTSSSIPKDLLLKVMEELKKASVEAPVKMHQVLLKNIFDTNVDIIATKEIK